VTAIRKGSKVVVVEGPSRGEQGIVLDVGRWYDPDTHTTGNRVKIELAGQDEFEDKKNTLTTRTAWVRELH
jgi:hypothetical protein